MVRRLQALREKGKLFSVQPTNDTLRFGDGAWVRAKIYATFEITILGHVGLLTISVVDRPCRPLFSRLACTGCGLQIDCERHRLWSRKIPSRGYSRAACIACLSAQQLSLIHI